MRIQVHFDVEAAASLLGLHINSDAKDLMTIRRLAHGACTQIADLLTPILASGTGLDEDEIGFEATYVEITRHLPLIQIVLAGNPEEWGEDDEAIQNILDNSEEALSRLSPLWVLDRQLTLGDKSEIELMEFADLSDIA